MLLTRFLPHNTKFDFIGKRWWGFAVSVIIVLVTIFALATKGLNFGIDFSGGLLLEVHAEPAPDLHKLREALSSGEFGEVSLQGFEDPRNVLIRIQSNKSESQAAAIEHAKNLINQTLGGQVEYRKLEYVGPQVERELVVNGALALGLSLLGMMAYLWFRFEWQFGVGGIAALIHDTIATIGFYAVTQLEFNLTSIAAVLTIIGYSINDSVVIYDRIRENLRKFKKMSTDDIINISVNEMIARTILTGGTVFVATLALVIFGGEVLKGFSWAMLFGVLVGTFSSIYISAPVLIYTGVRREGGEGQKPAVAAR